MAHFQRLHDPVKRVFHSLVLVWMLSTTNPGFTEILFPPNNLDFDLTSLLQFIEHNQLDRAIETSEELITRYPGSNGIALVYADLRNMLSLNTVSMASSENYSLHMLRTLNELTARLKHRSTEPNEFEIPTNLVKLRPETQHVIAVDLDKSRLYLLERRSDNGAFKLREHHYVSIGLGGSGKRYEGDLRTPIGIYDIDGFKPDNKLPKLYGVGAFTLNYPNSLDALSGRSGSGIWLHGMPHEQLSRPPQDSEGCIILQNALIDQLTTLVDRSNTPVLLSESLQWHRADAIDTAVLPSLKSAISRLYSNTTKTVLKEVILVPKGALGPENGAIYRVRFLLHEYSEPDSSDQLNTQYWWINTNETWSLLSEEA